MNWIALNIPLAVVLVGFAAGLPLWVTLKHPETDQPAVLDPSVLRVGSVVVGGRPAADATSSAASPGAESRLVYV